MGHSHHHQITEQNSLRLLLAIAVNLFLSLVQFIAGLLTGSLSLIADSLHNLGDVGALIIAYVSQKISGWRPTDTMTYGYARAEVIGAFVNSVLLILTSLYLIYEAFNRALSLKPVDGLWVVIVGFLALVVDLFTAFLTHKGAKESVNMKAAFLHNLSDAFASVGVIISGFFALHLDIFWVDTLATLGISVFILYHAYPLLKSCLRTLMQSVPEDINIKEVIGVIESFENVKKLKNLHVWKLYGRERMLEVQISIDINNLNEAEELKNLIKSKLENTFQISHSTIEFISNKSTQSCQKF